MNIKTLSIGLVLGLIIGLGVGFVVSTDYNKAELKEQINTLNGTVISLQSQLHEKDGQISELQIQLDNNINELQNKELENEELQQTIAELQGIDTSELERQITDLENQIAILRGQIRDKDRQITDLQKQINELEESMPPIKKGEWYEVAIYKGSSGRTTDYFYVYGKEMRLNWTWSSRIEEFASFSVYLYEEGDESYKESFVFLQNEDTTYIHDLRSANYYLLISAANLEQWTITVEVLIPE